LISDVQKKLEFSRIVHSLRRDGLEGKVSEDVSGVHRRIKCDGCKTSPVFGLRYKCVECADCDFCQNCVKKGFHQHRIFLVAASPNTQERLKSAFLKIRGC
jgi:late competence protein required for DNA uptake (superfamily II DNA/RNA helicase)